MVKKKTRKYQNRLLKTWMDWKDWKDWKDKMQKNEKNWDKVKRKAQVRLNLIKFDLF